MFLFLIQSIFALGQKNDLKYKRIEESVSGRNFSKPELDSFYLDLPVVKKTTYKTHIRISMTNQIIDLYSNNFYKFSGTLTNKIIEYKNIKNDCGYDSKPIKIIFQKILLDTLICSELASNFFNSGIDTIPTDTLIPSWNKIILDCGGVSFEIKKDNCYYEKYFSCPWSQNDSVSYKKLILNYYNQLYEKLKLKDLYNSFKDDLPIGKRYSYGMIIMYKMTKQESKAWNKDKPRREYLKKVKDTIDKSLKLQLSKKNLKFTDVDCFETYYISFGKNGKFKNVEAEECDKPRLKYGINCYFEDKKEIRKCKKKLKGFLVKLI